MKTISQRILAAVEWFEANPAKWLTGEIAADASKRSYNQETRCDILPTDPDAECFCAIGKIVKDISKETGEIPSDLADVYHMAAEVCPGGNTGSLWEANDRSGSRDTPFNGAMANLRALAAKWREDVNA